KVAIIGGGASGLVASIVAAQRGLKVSLFEKSHKVGRKILATGNGRCNITNEEISVQHYHGKSPSFVKPALNQFNTHEAKKFFSELGLEMREGANGRLYPMSLQSASVVDFLSFEAQRLGVIFKLSCEVDKVEKLGTQFRLKSNEDVYDFEAVLIATGSLAMPTLGSSESGYTFAKAFGHTIEKPFASLVQLISHQSAVHEASGVKLDAIIKIFIERESKMSVRGDLLFTNYGVSGSAILDISRHASFAISRKKEVKLLIDLLPDLSVQGVKSLLQKRLKLSQNQPISLWLNGIVHKKLTSLIFTQAKLSLSEPINSKVINKLAFAIKNLEVSIEETKGAKSCEVMAGGVSVGEVDPKTMQSKKMKGLFFSGEVLDIDGDCGGYNLHFAWASGMLAGKSI
ncbi:MAG: NAD(P)/FAD-dependent oxidoreductase, partial [Epsilonproteobacteria bacterium]|nr:NAD(P)/FAD-dependent oxidoreductase [Campylobacterota bacterium]